LLVFFCVQVESQKKNQKINIFKKRSHCESCKRQLKWHELIPVFSFIFLKGKCKTCDSKIPTRLFISEILLGLAFVNIFFFPLYPRDNPIGLLFFLFIIIYLFYLSYEDFLYQEIVSWKLYLFASLGFLSNLSFYLFEGGKNIDSFYILLSSTLLYLFFIFYSFFGKDKYMGQGDFLVLIGLLFFYGLENFINIFVYSIWIGAIISVFYLYKKYGKFKKGVTLSFIPFLFLGTLFFNITHYKIFIFKDILELINFLF
jgi:leader peptidase (prepilin peptidase)/N-methyltransferase